MNKKNVLRNLTPFGLFFYKLKIFRVYKNGTSSGIIFNYYNPISYPLIVLFVILMIIYSCIKGIVTEVNNGSFNFLYMTNYFRKNPEQLLWVDDMTSDSE